MAGLRLGSPGLGTLFSDRLDARKKRARIIAIIIPSYNRKQVLENHLDALALQSSHDFDIIIIYGMEDSFVETPGWSSILHLHRKWDYGSAGAFYAGEKLAVSDGYEKIILADDDCYPVSRDLVAKLGKALDSHTMAKPKLFLPPKLGKTETVLPQYGALREYAFKELGYSYLPLYSGFEDVELEERVRSRFGPPEAVDALASHPWFMPPILAADFVPKAHYLGHGSASHRHVLGRHFGAFTDLFFRGLKCVACLAIGRSDISIGYVNCLVLEYSSLLGMARPSFARMPNFAHRYKDEDVGPGSIDSIFVYGDFKSDPDLYDAGKVKSTLFFREKKQSEKIPGILHAIGNLGKNISFEGWFSDWDLKYALPSRRVALRNAGKLVWVTPERSSLWIASGVLLVFMAIPAIVFTAGFFSALGMANQMLRAPSNVGYGIDQEDG
jgi:hypothetical protein